MHKGQPPLLLPLRTGKPFDCDAPCKNMSAHALTIAFASGKTCSNMVQAMATVLTTRTAY